MEKRCHRCGLVVAHENYGGGYRDNERKWVEHESERDCISELRLELDSTRTNVDYRLSSAEERIGIIERASFAKEG